MHRALTYSCVTLSGCGCVRPSRTDVQNAEGAIYKTIYSGRKSYETFSRSGRIHKQIKLKQTLFREDEKLEGVGRKRHLSRMRRSGVRFESEPFCTTGLRKRAVSSSVPWPRLTRDLTRFEAHFGGGVTVLFRSAAM